MNELLQLRHNIRLALKPDLQGFQAEVELIFISRQLEYRLEVGEDGLQLGKENKIESYRVSASVNRLREIRQEIDALIQKGIEMEKTIINETTNQAPPQAQSA